MTRSLTRRDLVARSAQAGLALAVAPPAARMAAAQDDQAMELIFFGSASRTEHEDTAWTELKERFEAAYPNVTITHRFEGQVQDSIRRMQTAQVSGEPLDILKAGANNTNALLAPSGILLDITPIAEAVQDRFIPGAFDAVTIGDRVWVIPVSGAGMEFTGWYYNKTMFDELGLTPPQSYQDFLTVAEALRAEDLEPSSYDFANQYTPGMWFFETFAQTSGNNSVQYTQDALAGRRPWTSPEEIEALRLIKQFYDDGILAEGVLATDIEGVRALYQQQRIGMYYHGSWEWPWIRDNITEFETMVFEFPKIVDAPDVVPQHGGGTGNGIGLSATLHDQQAQLDMAAQYLEFVSRPENAQVIVDAVEPIGYPVQGVDLPTSPVFDYFTQVIQPSTIRFLDWIWPAELSQNIQSNIQSVLSDQVTPEEAMESVRQTYDRMVEQGYAFEWWETWSEEEWARVTPAQPPTFTVESA